MIMSVMDYDSNDSINMDQFNDLINMKTINIDNILNTFLTQDEIIDEKVCPTCESYDFIEDWTRGIIVCKCGQVIDDIQDAGYEKGHFEGDEDIARCGVVYNRLLPQSSAGTSVNTSGKIKRLHIWTSMPYKERSLNQIFKQIRAVCSKNNMTKKIEDDTKIICYQISKKQHLTGKNIGKPIITRGENRKGTVSSANFIACRRNGDSRSIKEIASYWNIDEKDVNKGLKSLYTILCDDPIIKDTGTSKVMDFIQRKCDELRIQKKYTELAITIADNIERMNIASNHTTYSLAAACILLMAEMNDVQHITKKKLSSVFGVSDVTIGKTFQQIEKYRTVLVDNILVNQVLERIMKQKEKRVITRETYKQMIRFGVDTSKYIVEDEIDNKFNVLEDHLKKIDNSNNVINIEQIANRVKSLDIRNENFLTIMENVKSEFDRFDQMFNLITIKL
jgi:transcription initiation factor TFIIIB Brf1 subunit/transcription initiation factor TFIIB